MRHRGRRGRGARTGQKDDSKRPRVTTALLPEMFRAQVPASQPVEPEPKPQEPEPKLEEPVPKQVEPSEPIEQPEEPSEPTRPDKPEEERVFLEPPPQKPDEPADALLDPDADTLVEGPPEMDLMPSDPEVNIDGEDTLREPVELEPESQDPIPEAVDHSAATDLDTQTIGPGDRDVNIATENIRDQSDQSKEEPDTLETAAKQKMIRLVFKIGRESNPPIDVCSDVITIGRDAKGTDNVLTFSSACNTVSKHHAEMRIDGDTVVLVDLNSLNGTTKIIDGVGSRELKGVALEPGKEYKVNPKDIFWFGDVVVSIESVEIIDSSEMTSYKQQVKLPEYEAAPSEPVHEPEKPVLEPVELNIPGITFEITSKTTAATASCATGKSVKIGSEESCDLKIGDDTVAPLHAELKLIKPFMQSHKIFVKSLNGSEIKVNGKPIPSNKEVKVKEQDTLTIGDAEVNLRFIMQGKATSVELTARKTEKEIRFVPLDPKLDTIMTRSSIWIGSKENRHLRLDHPSVAEVNGTINLDKDGTGPKWTINASHDGKMTLNGAKLSPPGKGFEFKVGDEIKIGAVTIKPVELVSSDSKETDPSLITTVSQLSVFEYEGHKVAELRLDGNQILFGRMSDGYRDADEYETVRSGPTTTFLKNKSNGSHLLLFGSLESNISRQHCRIYEQDGKTFIQDLDSYNGTRVNGALISSPVEIKPGDQVGIGDLVIKFQ